MFQICDSFITKLLSHLQGQSYYRLHAEAVCAIQIDVDPIFPLLLCLQLRDLGHFMSLPGHGPKAKGGRGQ